MDFTNSQKLANQAKNPSFAHFYTIDYINSMTYLKQLSQMLRTSPWYLKIHSYVVILQENGYFLRFSGHYTLSFGWYSYFTTENISVLHYASNEVQWSCLLWSADFIDPFYTKSSHCVGVDFVTEKQQMWLWLTLSNVWRMYVKVWR